MKKAFYLVPVLLFLFITLTAASPVHELDVSCHEGYYRTFVGSDLFHSANGGQAVFTYDENPAWTADIPGGEWIWESYLVNDPEVNESVEFFREFNVRGNPVSAELKVAADDSHEFYINGVLVHQSSVFSGDNPSTLDVTGYVQEGVNNISVNVTNTGRPGWSKQSNPAGLLYSLDIETGEPCTSLCPFESGPGRIVVDLEEESLLASSNPEGSVFPVSIPAGDYNVTLVSMDGYVGRTHQVHQDLEEWYLTLLKDGDVVTGTGIVSDVKDGLNFAKVTEVVNDKLVVFRDVDAVQAIHAHHPNSAHSVRTVCAVFDLIEENPYCEDVGDDRIVVDFEKTRLRVDKDLDDAYKGPFPTSINPGTYNVTLVSSDGYHNRRVVDDQLLEEWFSVLLKDGNVITGTGIVSDVPDFVDYASVVETVNDALVLNDYIDELFVHHAWFPYDDTSPQSVDAECAIFEKESEDVFCVDADQVFDVDMWVVSEDHHSGRVMDEVTLDIGMAGNHFVKGLSYRGNPGQCQTGEAYFLEVNDKNGSIAVDDPEPCIISTRLDELGVFYFNEGLNDVFMHTANDLSSANSVSLRKLCIYYDDDDPLCPFEVGDFCSQTQGGWGSPSNSGPGNLRDTYWDEVIGDNLTVGVGYNLTFTGPEFVEGFLPEGGPASPLAQSHVNPSSSEANVFGGQVTALKLNVLFSDAGIGLSTPGLNVSIGELYIKYGDFQGWTVYELLELAEEVLGGNASGLPSSASVSDLSDAVSMVNENFVGCEEDNGFLEWLTCEEEPVLGKLNVCKRVLDENGSLSTGEGLDSNFTIPLHGLADAFFSTPLTYNEDDYECVSYKDLELGDYVFEDEIIGSPENVSWLPPSYSPVYPDNTITLSKENPNKTLHVVNQVEEEVVEEINGSITVCKKLLNETGSLVTGESLNVNFTIPGSFGNTTFEVPLDYDNEVECVTYDDLPLGDYSFEEEIISSPDPLVEWWTPLYKVSSGSFNAFTDGNISLTEENPDKKIVVKNRFNVTEPEPVLGSIDICKQLRDENGSLTTGEGLNANFTIPLTSLTNAFFGTPLSYNEDDYECVSYKDLTLGEYYYDEEIIGSPENITWLQELYNPDYPDGSLGFFDGVGLINLTEEEPNRTLLVVNQVDEIVEEEVIRGNITVCKQLLNESGSLVTGEGLNVNFTIPGSFGNTTFEVPLDYDNGAECVTYTNLSLGNYSFEEETITSPDPLVSWEDPLYGLDGGTPGVFTDGNISLTDDNRNRTLLVVNQFNITEPEPVLGSIKVCKQLFNASEDLVSGQGINANFTIPLSGLPDAFFATPLSYEDGKACFNYHELELGEYFFGEEIIDSENHLVSWEDPLYGLDGGTPGVFTDGNISLDESNPNRTLLVVNQFNVTEPEPVLGNITVCKQLWDETESVVTGEGLNANFTIPGFGFPDTIFTTPLDYEDDLECVTYTGLSLGSYSFGEEIILDDNPLITWFDPLYTVDGSHVDPSSNGNISLTEDNRNRTLVVINMFEEHDIPMCIDINYTSPYYFNGTSQWINTESRVKLEVDQSVDECVEAGHYYRFEEASADYCLNACGSWNPSGYDADWSAYEGKFPLPEEACYVIEYYSDLGFANTSVEWDCVFMDKTPPTINKTVGTPRVEWNGSNSPFYPETESVCWNNSDGVECWNVTLDTPISFSCVDEGFYPSGVRDMCFAVEVNGDDVTEKYCDEYNGSMKNGSCCLIEDELEMTFLEESWHKLSLKCTDNVNKSSERIQYYKVEGESFVIELNKKWNLISVPVKLTDGSPDSVFGSLEHVLSVWAYDAVGDEWFVWTPDGPSNIDQVMPGWGYWVLMSEPENLSIDGSLFAPGPVTPPSRQLVSGWNLVGYYGTEGLSEYNGPWGNGKQASCVFSGFSVSSLLTYWEPLSPSPWVFLGANTGLDPGAGYWVFTSTPGVYGPGSMC